MGCKSCRKGLAIFKWRYFKNFIKFLWFGYKSKFKTVSFKEYNNRKAICHGCMWYDAGSERCTDCGCWVTKKAKYKHEDCPQGFWRK